MSMDLRELYDKVDGIGREYFTMNDVRVVDQDGNELSLIKNCIEKDNKIVLTFIKGGEKNE